MIDKIHFRNATETDTEKIWEILQQAIERRKKEGSQQWQDGYPNLETVKKDIQNEHGFVFQKNEQIVAYAAIIKNDEPAYEKIEGKWLTNEDFLVVHRVAVAESAVGKGIATIVFKKIEQFAKEKNIFSIKVDTNFDNVAMLRILEKLNYIYCGQVYFRGGARKAFEKVLSL